MEVPRKEKELSPIVWITLEDALALYPNMTEETLRSCLKENNIPTRCLNGKLFMDENVLNFHFTRNRLLIPPPPGNKEEQLAYEKVSSLLTNEIFLYLHLLNSDAPLTRLFVDDILWLIPNSEGRHAFFYVVFHDPFCLRVLRSKNYTLTDIHTVYRKWVKKIAHRLHQMHKSRDLAANCTYEIKTKNHILTCYEKEISRLQARIPDEWKKKRLTDEINALLNTPIDDLPFDTRVKCACWSTKHKTLGDLLTTGRNEGYSSLVNKHKGFGATSLKRMLEALRKMEIMDEYGYSYLYPYLPAWRKKQVSVAGK